MLHYHASVLNALRSGHYCLSVRCFKQSNGRGFFVNRYTNSLGLIRRPIAQSLLDKSPDGVKPYLRLIRLDKPIGTWLLYWPCTWSIAFAAPPCAFPDFYLLALFGCGSFLMRGAGCIINDLWDKDFDSKVARTKDRPLSSGQVTTFQAFCALGGLLSVSLAILLQLNWYSVGVGASSLLLVVAYPVCKRYTYWPQVVLGLTFNWGALLGWSAIHGCIGWSAFTLYASGLCWTMVYDTIYAHQDKADDMLIGVKSTALKFGENTKPWLALFGSSMIGGLGYTGYLCDQTWPFYVGLALTASQITWQISTLKINDSSDCWKKFCSNKYLGFILFSAIVAGNLLK